jgi:release factor glutamine methyltransferase
MVAQRFSQRFWSAMFKWRYRLFQRHRHRRLALEQFQIAGIGEFSLVILPDVFNPALFQTSVFLAEQIPKADTRLSVLEMGTGSGLCAIAAAKQGHDVVAVDINPEAVRCAQINALLNQVEVQVCVSDLFSAIGDQRFDLILFNPPFYKGKPRDLWEHAWRGVDVVERFVQQLYAHLTPRGSALVILSDKAEDFRPAFEQAGLEVTIAAQKSLLNETLTIYRLTPASADERQTT